MTESLADTQEQNPIVDNLSKLLQRPFDPHIKNIIAESFGDIQKLDPVVEKLYKIIQEPNEKCLSEILQDAFEQWFHTYMDDPIKSCHATCLLFAHKVECAPVGLLSGEEKFQIFCMEMPVTEFMKYNQQDDTDMEPPVNIRFSIEFVEKETQKKQMFHLFFSKCISNEIRKIYVGDSHKLFDSMHDRIDVLLCTRLFFRSYPPFGFFPPEARIPLISTYQQYYKAPILELRRELKKALKSAESFMRPAFYNDMLDFIDTYEMTTTETQIPVSLGKKKYRYVPIEGANGDE